MHIALKLASLVGLATLASALPGSSCSEALRFWDFQVSPTTLAPGDSITVLENNNGHEAPILLARRTFDNTTSPPADSFTTTLPSWFYFADAQYSVVLTNLFARAGPTGEQVITSGGVIQPITITGI
ncbi:hypothetical protein C8J57DRAFT_1310283 [Mycena rebaudengoi]|nr:hypothetical protein C8J57DRAFT_1310283 [Mycena rebaudengoi]